MTFSRIGGTVNRTIYDQQGSTSQTPGKVVRRDGQGLPFLGLVNYGSNYDNAFWDNAGHMFFGDGDGKL